MTQLPTESYIKKRMLSSCPVLEEILETSETITASGEKISTRGFSTVRNLIVLNRLMELGKFDKTLEIGLAHGGSALSIVSAHREFGQSSDQQHVAIDPFQHGYLKGAGLHALKRAGLSQYVEHIEDLSKLALPSLVKTKRKYGLIYIDGSHSFDDAFVDFYFCDHLLDLHGYMVFDDCADRRVRKVTRFIDRNYSHVYKKVPLTELFEVSRRWRLHCAKAVGRNQITVYQRIADDYRTWDSPLNSF